MKFSKRAEDLIADFRGLPRVVTGSSRREPAPLEGLLARLQEEYKLDQLSPERNLVENWERVFGPGLAARCHPVRIKDDRALVISVTNQTLRSELQFRKRAILQRIRKLERCEGIRELVIRG